MNWPKPYTTATAPSPYQLPNCSSAARIAMTSPTPKPIYGINTASPVKTPTGTPISKPAMVRPIE
ncbi:hypothetical protein D3C72_1851820 [compost metagenome]